MDYLLIDNTSKQTYIGTYGEMLGLSLHLERVYYWTCKKSDLDIQEIKK